MRKTLFIATREYLSAVRTKAFVISLLILPMMAAGSMVLVRFLMESPDIDERVYAVIDRSPKGKLAGVIVEAVAEYNEKHLFDPKTGKQTKPPFAILNIEPIAAMEEQRFDLSEQVRQGALFGFLEIGPGVYETGTLPPHTPGSSPDPSRERRTVRYRSNRPTGDEFFSLSFRALSREIRVERALQEGLTRTRQDARRLLEMPVYDSTGLAVREAQTGAVKEASEQNRLALWVVPGGMSVLMILGMFMGATPLMQSVIEEKMQRIAEVLLGSVRPFELMLGKLLGMTGVSLTIVSVYLVVAVVGAHWSVYAEYLTPSLVIWFLIYQVLVVLLYGSFFIAIGAACTNMKETQNLLWPVMLLASIPMIVLVNLLREPNSTAITVLSFFPPTTPMLMIARQAIPPGVPWWQPVLGTVLVAATTLACVWAAGRIFRVGLLMQGRGATIREIVRWVVRG